MLSREQKHSDSDYMDTKSADSSQFNSPAISDDPTGESYLWNPGEAKYQLSELKIDSKEWGGRGAWCVDSLESPGTPCYRKPQSGDLHPRNEWMHANIQKLWCCLSILQTVTFLGQRDGQLLFTMFGILISSFSLLLKNRVSLNLKGT